MQDPQTATAFFFGPVAAAYLTACALWLAYDWRFGLARSEGPPEETAHPYWDMLLTLAAGAGIFLLGAAYRAGWLLPSGPSAVGRAGWIVDNLVIYSPIAAVLVIRRQSPQTVFLSGTRLPEKILLGIALGLVAMAIYAAMRGELGEVPGNLAAAVKPETLANFPAVFFEGVALAFAFVRLRWAVGSVAAIAIPSLLFAAAHVPGAVEAGRTAPHIAAFFAFNTALPAAILWTVGRSRDVVWIGLAHYLMDVAIRVI